MLCGYSVLYDITTFNPNPDDFNDYFIINLNTFSYHLVSYDPYILTCYVMEQMCDFQTLEYFGGRMREALTAQTSNHGDTKSYGKEWVALVKAEADIAAMVELILAEHEEMFSR